MEPFQRNTPPVNTSPFITVHKGQISERDFIIKTLSEKCVQLDNQLSIEKKKVVRKETELRTEKQKLLAREWYLGNFITRQTRLLTEYITSLFRVQRYYVQCIICSNDIHHADMAHIVSLINSLQGMLHQPFHLDRELQRVRELEVHMKNLADMEIARCGYDPEAILSTVKGSAQTAMEPHAKVVSDSHSDDEITVLECRGPNFQTNETENRDRSFSSVPFGISPEHQSLIASSSKDQSPPTSVSAAFNLDEPRFLSTSADSGCFVIVNSDQAFHPSTNAKILSNAFDANQSIQYPNNHKAACNIPLTNGPTSSPNTDFPFTGLRENGECALPSNVNASSVNVQTKEQPCRSTVIIRAPTLPMSRQPEHAASPRNPNLTQVMREDETSGPMARSSAVVSPVVPSTSTDIFPTDTIEQDGPTSLFGRVIQEAHQRSSRKRKSDEDERDSAQHDEPDRASYKINNDAAFPILKHALVEGNQTQNSYSSE